MHYILRLQHYHAVNSRKYIKDKTDNKTI